MVKLELKLENFQIFKLEFLNVRVRQVDYLEFGILIFWSDQNVIFKIYNL